MPSNGYEGTDVPIRRISRVLYEGNTTERVALCREEIAKHSDPAAPEWVAYRVLLARYLLSSKEDLTEDNVEEAISACQEVIDSKTDSKTCAAAHLCIAQALRFRLIGDSTENLLAAVRHYEIAMSHHSRAAESVVWASIQLDMAVAYSAFKSRDQSMAQAAILHYEQALQVFRSHGDEYEGEVAWITVELRRLRRRARENGAQ